MTRSLCWAVLLAIFMSGVTILSRPLLPVDETRYLSVAWQAHQDGDYLVSHLNGETYAHKPPLLFWLINAVWKITGVAVTPARLVGPAAAIGCLLATSLLARRLWPDSPSTVQCAPLILVSSMLWMVLFPLTMFDTLMTLAGLSALLGVARAADGQFWSGWFIAGISMGLGILTKGPVILVHVLPTALSVWWWAPQWRGRLWKWHLGLSSAIGIAAMIGLAWALPAAKSGGPAYANELLFGQTAGRMVESFAHEQSFWWYLPWLPLCVLPWLLFVPVWRSISSYQSDRGLKFVLVAALGTLTIMSLVSGKQIHYLVPLLPHCAMAFSRLANRSGQEFVSRRDQLVPAAGTIVMGIMPLIFNTFAPFGTRALTGLVADIYCIPFVLCGIALLVRPRQSTPQAVATIATFSIVFMATVVFALSATLWDGFDLKPLAEFVRQSNRPTAWYKGYHGQINFLGHMSVVKELSSETDLGNWLRSTPNAIVVHRLPSGDNKWQDILPTLRTMDRTTPTAAQQRSISEYLSKHEAFPLSDWGPKVLYVQWIHSGLLDSPHLVVIYDDLQPSAANR